MRISEGLLFRVSCHLVQGNCQFSIVFFRAPTEHNNTHHVDRSFNQFLPVVPSHSMISRASSRFLGRRVSCIHRRMNVDATQVIIPLLSGGIPVAAVIIYLKLLMTKDNVHLQEVLGNRITSIQESSAKDMRNFQESSAKRTPTDTDGQKYGQIASGSDGIVTQSDRLLRLTSRYTCWGFSESGCLQLKATGDPRLVI